MHVKNEVVWDKLKKIDEIASNTSVISAETKLSNQRLTRIEDDLKGKLDASTFRWVIGGCCALFLLIIQHFHG